MILVEDHVEIPVGRDDFIPNWFETLIQSTFVRQSKNGCSSNINERMLRVCTWSCHVTAGYLDILQFIEDSHSEFDII